MATLPTSMPSAVNPAKRRRLDDALSKPFRSPLKTPLQPKTADSPTASIPATPQPKPQTNNLQKPTDIPSANPPTQQPLAHTLPSPAAPNTSPPTPTTTTNPSTHLHALQSHHTALLTLLTHRRAALETSSQALAIETAPDREADLQRLILKWKGASRRAAEEVFAGARDRVNRMGGVRELRERERERAAAEVGWEWGDSGSGGGGGDENEEEDGDVEGVGDKEARLEREGFEEEYKREMRAGVEDGGGEVEEEEVDEEGGYTMDMMLRTMNIELEVIGFDKRLQKWID